MNRLIRTSTLFLLFLLFTLIYINPAYGQIDYIQLKPPLFGYTGSVIIGSLVVVGMIISAFASLITGIWILITSKNSNSFERRKDFLVKSLGVFAFFLSVFVLIRLIGYLTPVAIVSP